MSESVGFSEDTSILRGMLTNVGAKDSMDEVGEMEEQDPLSTDKPKEVMVFIVKDEPKVEVMEHEEDQKDNIDVGCLEQETASTSKIIEDEDFKYESFVVKMYISNFIKEEPVENIDEIFKNSCLDFEKQAFHRQMINNVFEKMGRKKLEVLQSSYIQCLRKVASLETFSCLKCDYLTMHKGNLKTHLHLIHKKEMEETWFKCLQCEHKLRTLAGLRTHQLTHSESDDSLYDLPIVEMPIAEMPRMQECDLCIFTTEYKDVLEEHRKTHLCPNDPKRYLCYLCNHGVKDKKRLQKHIFKVHQIKLKGIRSIEELKCSHCDYTTDSKACFEIHSMKHKNPDEITWFKCTQCDFKTKHSSSLQKHSLGHKNPEKKFLCHLCSKRFFRKSGLKAHILTHKDIRELTEVKKCSQCSFQTKSKTCLTQHMEMHREPEYVCHVCGLKSRRKYNHLKHVRTHQNFNECEIFKCSVCPYQTKFKLYLKTHLTRGKHDMNWKPKERGSKPAETVCNICGDKLSSATALMNHLDLHKDPEERTTYKCPECDFQTKSKYSINQHQKDLHSPQFLNCEVCGIRIKIRHYKRHVKIHQTVDESELLSCPVCNYQTKFKPYLREHLKKRHKIIPAPERRGKKPKTSESKSELEPGSFTTEDTATWNETESENTT